MLMPGFNFVSTSQLIGEAAEAKERCPRIRFGALTVRNAQLQRSKVNGQIALSRSEHRMLGASVLAMRARKSGVV
jgi:hypothetical protein